MTTKLPSLSIVTPAYNRANLIGETIESVLAQDYPDLDYVVLDDGSTDDTLAVIRRYEGRLRYEHHPNMGEARTVNRGFQLSRGDMIGVVNSDDPLLPGALAALAQAARDHPDVLVFYPDWDMIDEHGAIIHHVRALEHSYVDLVRWHYCYVGPAALFRRSLLKRIGGRDPSFRYHSDYDFWLRAGLLGPFRRVPRTLATWRSHSMGATNAKTGEQMSKEHVRTIDKLYARDDLPAEVLAVKAEAYRNAFYVAGHACGRRAASSDERFQWWDVLHERIYKGSSATPIDTIAILNERLKEREARLAELYESYVKAVRELEQAKREVAGRDASIVQLNAAPASAEMAVRAGAGQRTK